jgi:hypothetical protein
MKPQSTLNIPESGECPECREKHNNWTPYIRPEEDEIGVFCPKCYTHFRDNELSSEQFEFDDYS